MIEKNTAKRYLADVKSALKDVNVCQRSVIACLNADIQDYISENPDATEADLLAHFGNPRDYAAEYVAAMPLSEHKARMSAKKRVITAVTVGVLAALLIWGIGVGIAAVNNNLEDCGYIQIRDG